MRHEIIWFHDFKADNRLSMEVYADELFRAIEENGSGRFQVDSFRPEPMPWPRRLSGHDLMRMRLSRYVTYPWQAHRHQRQLNHILDHGYGHLVYAVRPGRTVVTVHDLIPLVRWRGGIPGLSPGRKPWLNLLSLRGLRLATRLIAVSENTRRDLIRFCNCAPDRIDVVYHGVDPFFKPYGLSQKLLLRRELDLPSEIGTQIVLVSGSQWYKNHTGALKAFARLLTTSRIPMQLIKIGAPTMEWARTVRELGLEEATRCLGIVPHHELPKVFNSADCLLFPSFYEGFGWPPLEAMACGVPVVASNTSSLPEVIGDAGLMCPPNDYDGLAQAIYNVLTNDYVRQMLVERGLARARQFTWEKTAQQTLAVYHRMAKQLVPRYRKAD